MRDRPTPELDRRVGARDRTLFHAFEDLAALCLDTSLSANVSLAGSDERLDARRRSIVLAEIPGVCDHSADPCASAPYRRFAFVVATMGTNCAPSLASLVTSAATMT